MAWRLLLFSIPAMPLPNSATLLLPTVTLLYHSCRRSIDPKDPDADAKFFIEVMKQAKDYTYEQFLSIQIQTAKKFPHLKLSFADGVIKVENPAVKNQLYSAPYISVIEDRNSTPETVIPRLYDHVALLVDLTELGLYRGQVGTVIEEYESGVYEVEFSNHEGRAYAQKTLRAEQLLILYDQPKSNEA